MNTAGLVFTVSSFLIWGLVPIYWKLLKGTSAFLIVNHRAVWTATILLIFLGVRKKIPSLIETFKDRKKILSLLLSTACISTNWGIFVWTVNADKILDTSLGYYINPLLNVLFGATILKEKFSKIQFIAILSASIGVLIMAFAHGDFPWIALSLAGTFGLYGLVRKMIPVSSDVGLTTESVVLFLPALIYIFGISSDSGFTSDARIAMLLVGGGFITTIPLLLYLEGVRRIPYSTVGILQFLTPTTTFLIAVFIYKESFGAKQLISFSFIWLAVIIYIIDISILKRTKA